MAAQGGAVEGLPESLSTGPWSPAESLQLKSAGNLGGMLVGEGAGGRGGRSGGGGGGGGARMVGSAAVSNAIPTAAGGRGGGGGRQQQQNALPQQNTFTPAPVMLTFVPHVDVDEWHVTDEGARVVVEGVGSGHCSCGYVFTTIGTFGAKHIFGKQGFGKQGFSGRPPPPRRSHRTAGARRVPVGWIPKGIQNANHFAEERI